MWALLALSTFAVFLRFYGLLSLPLWPQWDDANYCFFAVQLAEKWKWQLFWGSEKTMPLFTWLQGVFFKFMGPSLFSLWFYPAFLSLFAVPLSYVTTRLFFSRSFAWICTLLMALGFWPLYYGRFCTYLGSLNVVAMLVLAAVWGRWVTASPNDLRRRTLWLGLSAGIGLYVSVLFLVSAALCGFSVTKLGSRKRGGSPALLAWFLIPVFFLDLPLLPGLYRNLLIGHIYTHSLFNGDSLSLLHQVVTSFSYLTVFFWGAVDQSYWSFQPLWGGYLDPLWCAFFFLGLTELARFWKKSFLAWLMVISGAFFLPLFFLNTLECMRLVLLMPLVIGVVAIGLSSLLASLPMRSRGVFLFAVLSLSLAWDGYHLFFLFHRWSHGDALTPGLALKSPERLRAFQVLRQEAQQEGPGLIFTDFVSDIYDQSLLVATYPFNAARNPRLPVEQSQWAGVLSEAHYQTLLKDRFPEASFFPLSETSTSPLLLLAVIPFNSPQDRSKFDLWVKLHRPLQDLYGLMPYHVKNPDFHPVLRGLQNLYPSAAGDPLLKAWVLEKIADILLVSDDMTDAQWFLGQPVSAWKTFPFVEKKLAWVYHKLGLGLLKNGDKGGARECFYRASIFDPKYDLGKFLAICR